MKTFDFALDKFQMEQVFSVVRDKEDIIKLWMRAIKLMAAFVAPDADVAAGKMRLHVDKMSRLLFISEDKVFSVNFPFSTQLNDGFFAFSSLACGDIDSRMTSEILSLISTHKILSINDIYSFMDPISASSEIQDSIWALFKYLMVSDDGYIRFDHDTVRENGNLHPRNHLDVFYSTSTTFKIGLDERISIADFVDLLDVGTDCHFLNRK